MTGERPATGLRPTTGQLEMPAQGRSPCRLALLSNTWHPILVAVAIGGRGFDQAIEAHLFTSICCELGSVSLAVDRATLAVGNLGSRKYLVQVRHHPGITH